MAVFVFNLIYDLWIKFERWFYITRLLSDIQTVVLVIVTCKENYIYIYKMIYISHPTVSNREL